MRPIWDGSLRFDAQHAVGLLTVGALCWVSCSVGPISARGSRVLDREGGTLRLADVADVVVAAGALDGPVSVQATVVKAPVPLSATGVSEVLALTPHGVRFAIPARVSLRYASTAPLASLQVMRLADDADTTWEPVGGVRFEGGVATFDTPGFSYYVVTEGGTCELVETPTACSSGCECCGSAVCVNVATDVKNCGGCGIACDARSFCSSASTCQPAGPMSLCANRQLYVIQGQLPDLTVVNPEQTQDGLYAARMAALIAATCEGLSVLQVSQAAEGLLDPCTDAPLVGGGTTLLVTGGTFAQRVARYLEESGEPVFQEVSADNTQYSFFSRLGTPLVSFPRATLNDGHDYFVLAFSREPANGAQVFQVFGVGWEGTPAASWYFEHRLLPAIRAGTVSWSRYLMVEWTDDGDGLQGEGDTFTVLAQDVP